MREIRELIDLEVLGIPDKTVEELQEMGIDKIKSLIKRRTTEKYYLIDDTSKPYIVKIVTSKPEKLRSFEPELLPNGDDFEIMESIQEILKENNVPVYKSDFDKETLDQVKNNRNLGKQLKELADKIRTTTQEGMKKIINKKVKEEKEKADIVDAEIEVPDETDKK